MQLIMDAVATDEIVVKMSTVEAPPVADIKPMQTSNGDEPTPVIVSEEENGKLENGTTVGELEKLEECNGKPDENPAGEEKTEQVDTPNIKNNESLEADKNGISNADEISTENEPTENGVCDDKTDSSEICTDDNTVNSGDDNSTNVLEETSPTKSEQTLIESNINTESESIVNKQSEIENGDLLKSETTPEHEVKETKEFGEKSEGHSDVKNIEEPKPDSRENIETSTNAMEIDEENEDVNRIPNTQEKEPVNNDVKEADISSVNSETKNKNGVAEELSVSTDINVDHDKSENVNNDEILCESVSVNKVTDVTVIDCNTDEKDINNEAPKSVVSQNNFCEQRNSVNVDIKDTTDPSVTQDNKISHEEEEKIECNAKDKENIINLDPMDIDAPITEVKDMIDDSKSSDVKIEETNNENTLTNMTDDSKSSQVKIEDNKNTPTNCSTDIHSIHTQEIIKETHDDDDDCKDLKNLNTREAKDKCEAMDVECVEVKCATDEQTSEPEKIDDVKVTSLSSPSAAMDKDVAVIDCDDIDDVTEKSSSETKLDAANEPVIAEPAKVKKTGSICGLSNNLDILSDDDDVIEQTEQKTQEPLPSDNKCINIDDDDDVMLIDDAPVETEKDTPEAEKIEDSTVVNETKQDDTINLDNDSVNETKQDDTINLDNDSVNETKQDDTINLDNDSETEGSKPIGNDVKSPDVAPTPIEDNVIESPVVNEKTPEPIIPSPVKIPKPIIPENFLKIFRKNVIEMSRDELEEFCLMKIVEGIIDQTNLSDVKEKMKNMASNVEEWKKKVVSLTKQNRDLQIVLKTVQEEQKKRADTQVMPLKITRSVGMQVFMTEAVNKGPVVRRKLPPVPGPSKNKPNAVSDKSPAKKPSGKKMVTIPVPRLVPAASGNSPIKTKLGPQVQNATVTSNTHKQSPQNGIKPGSTVIKAVEKRPYSNMQSVTVDLTDDEPPAKVPASSRNAHTPPVRLVSQQQLMKPRSSAVSGNSARKVFIPINPNSNLRPGQTITLKSVAPAARGMRPGGPGSIMRVTAANSRPTRPNAPVRHPAPLPEVAKQQHPPNWKALPPSPDLKISKVENGIVISWKIDDFQEESYEEIASYQLYAYQETSSPPSTMLWKKIGDVKALPLPMACTLTQFMAGYKYYFAVRAVDIRSRIGPFSLPGSILLLNK